MKPPPLDAQKTQLRFLFCLHCEIGRRSPPTPARIHRDHATFKKTVTGAFRSDQEKKGAPDRHVSTAGFS
jgi:hypothetical protein